jgi:hypothetical protein
MKVNGLECGIRRSTAAQEQVAKIFWPKVESNATFYSGGTTARPRSCLRPSILIGRGALHPDHPHSRPGLGFGGGMQIAASQFHRQNHKLIVTGATDLLILPVRT